MERTKQRDFSEVIKGLGFFDTRAVYAQVKGGRRARGGKHIVGHGVVVGEINRGALEDRQDVGLKDHSLLAHMGIFLGRRKVSFYMLDIDQRRIALDIGRIDLALDRASRVLLRLAGQGNQAQAQGDGANPS